MSHTNHETRRRRRENARWVRSLARSVLHWQANADTWDRLGRPENAAESRARAAAQAEKARLYCVANLEHQS